MNKYLFFSLLIILSSCSIKNKVAKLNDKDILVSLDKGPCATKCSEYNIKVYKNGYVVYEGKTNVEKYGLYAKKMVASDIKKLQAEFDKNEFFSFDDVYPNPDPDMPTIIMAYNKDGKTKTITGGLDRPKKVLDLQRTMESLAKSNDLKLLNAYEPKTTSITKPKDENEESEEKPVSYIIDNEIIIEMKQNQFLSQWLKKYTQYQVQLVRKVSEQLPYWVITFNRNTIEPETMLSIIQQDEQIQSAEFNKKVSQR